MAEARIATVDVYVIRGANDGWDVLLMRRAPDTRCTGAWEAVHGRIEESERPEDAALRELREETGLEAERLYNVAVQPFYLHTLGVVTLAVAFAAVVRSASVQLGTEHDAAEWLPLEEARERVAWPRSRAALADIAVLLRTGDAGAVEDVLRVR